MANQTYRIQQRASSVEFLGQLFAPFEFRAKDIRKVFMVMRDLAQSYHRAGKPVFVEAVMQGPDVDQKLAAENALVVSSYEILPSDIKAKPRTLRPAG